MNTIAHSFSELAKNILSKTITASKYAAGAGTVIGGSALLIHHLTKKEYNEDIKKIASHLKNPTPEKFTELGKNFTHDTETKKSLDPKFLQSNSTFHLELSCDCVKHITQRLIDIPLSFLGGSFLKTLGISRTTIDDNSLNHKDSYINKDKNINKDKKSDLEYLYEAEKIYTRLKNEQQKATEDQKKVAEKKNTIIKNLAETIKKSDGSPIENIGADVVVSAIELAVKEGIKKNINLNTKNLTNNLDNLDNFISNVNKILEKPEALEYYKEILNNTNETNKHEQESIRKILTTNNMPDDLLNKLSQPDDLLNKLSQPEKSTKNYENLLKLMPHLLTQNNTTDKTIINLDDFKDKIKNNNSSYLIVNLLKHDKDNIIKNCLMDTQNTHIKNIITLYDKINDTSKNTVPEDIEKILNNNDPNGSITEHQGLEEHFEHYQSQFEIIGPDNPLYGTTEHQTFLKKLENAIEANENLISKNLMILEKATEENQENFKKELEELKKLKKKFNTLSSDIEFRDSQLPSLEDKTKDFAQEKGIPKDEIDAFLTPSSKNKKLYIIYKALKGMLDQNNSEQTP